MAEKVTTMELKVVDLDCPRCYKKVKKLLCRYSEIRDQLYDEKENTVTITVVSCNPESIREKLSCKGCKIIQCIEIVDPLPSLRELKARIKELEERAKKLEQRAKELEQKDKELEKKAKELEQLAKLLDQKAKELEQRSKQTDQKGKELEQWAKQLEEKAEKLEEKAKALEEKAQALEEKAKKLGLVCRPDCKGECCRPCSKGPVCRPDCKGECCRPCSKGPECPLGCGGACDGSCSKGRRGACWGPCSEGREGGPCHYAYGTPVPCYDGFYAYGGGRGWHVSRCDDYYCQENATACTIM